MTTHITIILVLLATLCRANELYVQLADPTADPTAYVLTADQPASNWSRAYRLADGEQLPADAVQFARGDQTWYVVLDWATYRAELRAFRAHWLRYFGGAISLEDLTTQQQTAARTRVASLRSAKADGLTPAQARVLLRTTDAQFAALLDLPRLYPEDAR